MYEPKFDIDLEFGEEGENRPEENIESTCQAETVLEKPDGPPEQERHYHLGQDVVGENAGDEGMHRQERHEGGNTQP